MMLLIRETFFNLRFLDIADMAMVAALLWSAMVLLRRTRARVALTGQSRSAGIFEVMELIGAPRTVARLRRAAAR